MIEFEAIGDSHRISILNTEIDTEDLPVII